MKDKLIAVLTNPCDNDIKSELLEEMIRFYCEEYIAFSVERNDLIISAMGINGFIDDIQSVTRIEIFQRFKDYLKEKYKKNDKGANLN